MTRDWRRPTTRGFLLALLTSFLTLRSAEAYNSTTILNNGPTNQKLNIVFVGDGFTAAELPAYQALVTSYMNYLFTQYPYSAYKSYFNVHRVDVISNQSGIDNESCNGQLVDTALGTTFWGCTRLLFANPMAVYAAADDAPAYDPGLVFVLANTNVYGGSGGNFSIFYKGTDGQEVMVHEMGHSFAKLGDEYYDGSTAVYPYSEPLEPNLTIETNRNLIKWRALINPATAIPTTGVTTNGVAGLFQGASALAGIYRPTYNSKMRSLYQPFDVVNADIIIAKINQLLNLSPAPVAVNQSVSTAEDTAKVILLAATDPSNLPLTYSIVTAPAHGTLSGSGDNQTYTPTANYNGPDSFTFKANNGSVDSNTATVTLTVTAVNDAPVASNQSVTTAKDTAKTITLAATDVDAQPLTYSIVSSPTHGSLTGSAPSLTYTPTTSYTGADSFTFRANDGTVNSNTATVTITVTGSNAAPVASNQSATTTEDTPKPITLAATDVDSPVLTYAIVASPTHGTISGTPPSVTYTPAAHYNGSDSFTFRAHDGIVNSNTATVSLTVTAVNDAPTATFSANPSAGLAPLAVQWDGSASSDVDGSITHYAWDFGDGQTATGITATHVYLTTGTYMARLTVTDNLNLTGTATTAIIALSSIPVAPVAPGQVTLNLPSYIATNGYVTAQYAGATPASLFTWSFTPAGTTTPAPRPSTAANITAASSARSASMTTASPQADLASAQLATGRYVITVQVIGPGNQILAEAQATATLVNADLSSIQVYPNPWRSDRGYPAHITFAGLPADTSIKVFTVAGHQIKALPRSSSTAQWDLTNDSGDKVASGIYMYLITADQGQKKTGKLVIIK